MNDSGADVPDAPSAPDGPDALPRKRAATVAEAKALAHPLRIRILRVCRDRDLTNKQIAEELGTDPGTTLYHVRQLVDVGFLEPVVARPGPSGVQEKPYRNTGASWWLENPLGSLDADSRAAPFRAFTQEFERTGPESLVHWATFVVHLADSDVAEMDSRIKAILDEYIATNDQRAGQPAYAGMYALHRRDPESH